MTFGDQLHFYFEIFCTARVLAVMWQQTLASVILPLTETIALWNRWEQRDFVKSRKKDAIAKNFLQYKIIFITYFDV